MPVTAVLPAGTPARSEVVPSSVPPTVPASRAVPFDAVLAASRLDPARAPTVTLGEMVAAFAGRPVASVAPALPPGAADTMSGVIEPRSSAAPAVRDDWGEAGDRPAVAASARGAAVLDAGERYLGVPYRWGGTSASSGFDCSGFVQQVFADVGVRLPRVSVDQSRQGRAVASMAQAQPGDLVFWRGSGSRPNHIGIYAGDGTMLVAPRTGDVVRYQTITRPPDLIRRVVD